MTRRVASSRKGRAVWVFVGAALAGCAAGVAPEGGAADSETDAGGFAVPADDADAGILDLGDAACLPWHVDHVPATAATSVMFVLDKSGSMRETWDHDGDPSTAPVSRWWSLRTSMARWVDQYGARLEAGVQLFPRVGATSTVADGCEMATAPEIPLGQLAPSGLALLPDAHEAMYGATPATLGVRAALDALASRSSSRRRAVVLVTDGAANCREGTQGYDLFNVYDELLEDEVARAFGDRGIPTYVVGIDIIDGPWTGPDVNPHEALSGVARAGGVARPGPVPYYAVSGPAQLDVVFDQITAAVECGVDVPEGIESVGSIVVEADEDIVPRVAGCVGTDGEVVSAGWAWGVGIEPSIELCGATCQAREVTIEHRCE